MRINEELINSATAKIKSKNTKNTLFIILAVLFVLFINALLPVIEGSAHYTENAVTVSYKEYNDMYEQDHNYALTHKSTKEIKKFSEAYINNYNETHTDGDFIFTVPEGVLDDVSVDVYTQFFFTSYSWYVDTLLSIVSVLVIYYSVFNYILDKMKDTNKEYIDNGDLVKNAVLTKVDPSTFEPYMYNVFNKERKSNQHISNIKLKIDKLYHKTPYRVRCIETNKHHAKYIEKLNELNEKLTDDYINNYALNSKIKGYKIIYPSFVQNGVNQKYSISVDEYSLIKSDTGKISSDATKKILTSVLLTTLFALVITFTVSSSIDKPVYWIILNIFVKITPLLLQIPMAYDYANSFMHDQLIPIIQYRMNIIVLYLKYTGEKQNNGNKDQSRNRYEDSTGTISAQQDK